MWISIAMHFLKCVLKLFSRATHKLWRSSGGMFYVLLHHCMLYLLCSTLSCSILCIIPIFPVDIQHLYLRLVLTFMLRNRQKTTTYKMHAHTDTDTPHHTQSIYQRVLCTVQQTHKHMLSHTLTPRNNTYGMCVYANSRYFPSIDSLYRTMTQIVNFKWRKTYRRNTIKSNCVRTNKMGPIANRERKKRM